MKSVVVDWYERAITIGWWHDRFREDPMRLRTEVPEVRVSVVVRRTDGAHERIISIPGDMFVFLLARGAPDRIKNMLAL